MVKKSTLLICSVLLKFCLFASPIYAQWISYETKIVAEGLNVPWEIRWGYDDWIWFTERSGRFTKIDPGSGAKKVLLQVPFADHSTSEKGTLGFDFHPDFPDSPYLFIAYNHIRDGGKAFNVVRWTYGVDTLIDPVIILDGLPTGDIHNGSRVKVGPDRRLYISTGEADFPHLAQDLNSKSGKILRLELDGKIPIDNPIAGNAAWSVGHRNPQGLAFSPTGQLYSTEHGHATDDEFNLVERGRNYGWPLVEGFCDRASELEPCASEDVRQPLAAWTPTLAVTGIEYADVPTFPEWKNSILMATLKDASLWVLKLDDNADSVIAQYRYPLQYTHDESELRRLRDYCFSPDGRLFVSTSNIWSKDWNPDRIVEIKRLNVIPFEVTLIEPPTGQLVHAKTVGLRWHRTAGDSRYQIQVANSGSFDLSSTLVDVTLTDTSHLIEVDSKDARYYWRVREVTSGGEWSSVEQFEVATSSVREENIKSLPAQVLPLGDRLTFDATGSSSGLLLSSTGGLVRRLTLEEISSGVLSTAELGSGVYFVKLDLLRSSRFLPINVVR